MLCTITTEQLLDMMVRHDDFNLINVLDKNDFERQHIPGSANIPVNDDRFLEHAEGYVSTPYRKIVVYDDGLSGELSAIAARKLHMAGFVNVYHYRGGMKEWIASNNESRHGW